MLIDEPSELIGESFAQVAQGMIVAESFELRVEAFAFFDIAPYLGVSVLPRDGQYIIGALRLIRSISVIRNIGIIRALLALIMDRDLAAVIDGAVMIIDE